MLIEFTLYGILAIACICVSPNVRLWLGDLAGFGMVAGGVVMAAASLTGYGAYITHTYLRGRRDWNLGTVAGELALKNADIAIFSQVRQFSPEQFAFMGRIKARIILKADAIEPEELIDLGGGYEPFPRKLVLAYLKDCGPIYFCPIRHYGEGTLERTVAKAFTEFMISNQFADPAIGNNSARWLLREAGLRAIGEWKE